MVLGIAVHFLAHDWRPGQTTNTYGLWVYRVLTLSGYSINPVAVTPLAELLKKTRLCAGGLFLLTLLLFYPAIHFGFLNYDDPRYVTQNEHVKQGLAADSIRWALTGPHHSMWHPVTSLSHLVDVQLFGMNPAAHHAVNIFIHAINAVLLYYWLLLVFNLPGRALVVAALFAWHPLRVESVVWISERKDVLHTCFWLLTLIAYTRYVRNPGKRSYLVLFGVFALGIMSKPMMVTMPAILLLLDGWPFKRLGITAEAETGEIRFDWQLIRQRVVEKIPFFILVLLLAGITYKQQHDGDVLAMMSHTPFAARVGNALVSYIRYLGLLFWPVDLSILYPHPGRWPVWAEMGSLAGLGAITYFCWRLRQSQPWWGFAWIWFLVTLLPVIGLVQAGAAALANRYSYISTTALLIAVVWSLAEWAAKDPASRRKPVMVGVFALLLSCGTLTMATLPFWRNTEALFREALRVTGPNPIAHMVLGETYLNEGRPQEALQQFSEGIVLTPGDAEFHLLAGRACMDLDRTEAAIQAFENALKLDPREDEAEFQLARAYRRVNRGAEARTLLLKYVEKHPENAKAWNNLANLQAEQRDMVGAEKSLNKALALEPDSLEARQNLIRLLAMSHRSAEALEQVTAGLRYHSDEAELWYQAGLLHEEAKNTKQARMEYEMAIKVRPEWPLPKESLIWLYVLQPKISEMDARQAYALTEEVVLSYGQNVPIRIRELQGIVLAANGDFAKAIEMAQKTRWVFEQGNDRRGVQRLDQQLAAFKANQRWLPASK